MKNLNLHTRLLDQIKACREAAAELIDSGARITAVSSKLKDCEREIQTRINYFSRPESQPPTVSGQKSAAERKGAAVKKNDGKRKEPIVPLGTKLPPEPTA